MAEKDWIEEAVKEFRNGCKELQDEKDRNIRHRSLPGTIRNFGHLGRHEAINAGASRADELVFFFRR